MGCTSTAQSTFSSQGGVVGERALVAQVLALRRQQPVGLEDGARHLAGRARFGRHVGQDLLQLRVPRAVLDENADYAQRAVRPVPWAAVDEVDLHGEAPAVQQVFARVVEVELQQFVRPAFHGQAAARRRVHLDGMARVGHAQRQRAPFDAEAAQLGRDRVAKVDRAFLRAGGADLVVRAQFGPVVRAARAGVAPFRAAARFGRGLRAARGWTRRRGDRKPGLRVACGPRRGGVGRLGCSAGPGRTLAAGRRLGGLACLKRRKGCSPGSAPWASRRAPCSHAPVFTVAESRELRGGLPGGHSKNLNYSVDPITRR